MQVEPESGNEKLPFAIPPARTGADSLHANAEGLNDLTMTLLVFSGDQSEPLEAALHLISNCRADPALPSERSRGDFLRHGATDWLSPWGEVAQLIAPISRCYAPLFPDRLAVCLQVIGGFGRYPPAQSSIFPARSGAGRPFDRPARQRIAEGAGGRKAKSTALRAKAFWLLFRAAIGGRAALAPRRIRTAEIKFGLPGEWDRSPFSSYRRCARAGRRAFRSSTTRYWLRGSAAARARCWRGGG